MATMSMSAAALPFVTPQVLRIAHRPAHTGVRMLLICTLLAAVAHFVTLLLFFTPSRTSSR